MEALANGWEDAMETMSSSMASSAAPSLASMGEGEFTVEDIVKQPLPGYDKVPGNLAYSTDDSLVTFLFSPQGNLTRQLYSYDTLSGEKRCLAMASSAGVEEGKLTREDQLRRERLRERGLGITSFQWGQRANGSLGGSTLLVPLLDGLYVMDPKYPGGLRNIYTAPNGTAIIDPQLSPDGMRVAFVVKGEIFITSVEEPGANENSDASQCFQLTHGAQERGVVHGVAEYIAQEEMLRRSGYWWSPEGSKICYAEVDYSDVPLLRIPHYTSENREEETHNYPFTGERNCTTRLFIADTREPRNPVQLDLKCGGGKDIYNEEEYLARVVWGRRKTIIAQLQSRHQNKLKVVEFDIHTGQRLRVLLEETSETWINLHDVFTLLCHPIDDHVDCFLWASEKSGFQHLYICSPAGHEICQLTQGEWMVDAVVGVDQSNKKVYFTGNRESSLETHLYVVQFVNLSNIEEPRRLTEGRGRHSVVISNHFESFIDTFDTLDLPPEVTLRCLKSGKLLASIHNRVDPAAYETIARLRMEPPTIFDIKTEESSSLENFPLYGAVYKPDESVFGRGPYPLIVSIYGGPNVQTVQRSWAVTVDMRAQYLRYLGYLVMKVDNRGSSRRGLAFERGVKNRLGSVELEDQIKGIEWLTEQGLCDPSRVAIYGWSYGGYLSAMALCRHPQRFKVAVSGAPVTDWLGYDTHYTERYMGDPSENAQGYKESSVMYHVSNMRGHLMLVHGMIDENVHFRHTARLVRALNANEKRYELIVFPDERHLPRNLRERAFIEQRVVDFFGLHL